MASHRIRSTWKLATAMLLGMMLCFFSVGSAFAQKESLTSDTCGNEAQILTAIISDKKVRPQKPDDGTLSRLTPDRPYAGSPEGMNPVTTTTSDAWQGWEGELPAPDLIQSWLNQTDASLADCWNNDTSAAPLHILSDAEYAYQMSGPFTRDKTIFTVGRPVFDVKRKRALVYVNTICPGLCGLSVLYTLGKEGDHWSIIGSRVLWIS